MKYKTSPRAFCDRQGVCQLDMPEEEVNFTAAVTGDYQAPMS